ncbi:MAG: hypothetical protein LUE27_06780 [Clostridia bacterium]|nr:hypothetical protein [Clostridia bacterium]
MVTEKQLENITKAHKRIQRGWRTIDTYSKQDKSDSDLAGIRNTLESGLEQLEKWLEEHKEEE